MDIRLLQTFCCVVKLGGFRRAADHLNTTQPSVSARISQLEALVGGNILDRDRGRPASPTSLGLELLGYAEQILALHSTMLINLRSTELDKGVVRLGVSETVTYLWLPRLIETISRTYPNVTVDVTVDVSHQLSADLLAGEIDVAILLGPVESAEVVNLDIEAIPLNFLVSPTHRLATTPATLAEIVRDPIITFSRVTAPYRGIVSFFADHGCRPARMYGCNSLASAVQLIQSGLGVGVLPPAAVRGMKLLSQPVFLATGVTLPVMRFTASCLDLPGSTLAMAVAKLAQDVSQEGLLF